MSPPRQALTFSAGIALAYIIPLISKLPVTKLLQLQLGSIRLPVAQTWTCGPSNYTTELISLDPLVIYIHNLVSPDEAAQIMLTGEPLLEPSPVTGYGVNSPSQSRTSWSAPLPAGDEDDDSSSAVQCVLARAERFMGTLMAPGRDEMGVAQMVRYTRGQKFDLHHDWFQQPRLLDSDSEAGRRRLYNRVATFFVVLQDNCTEGETYFPRLEAIAPQDRGEGSAAVWRAHEEGGLAFRPVAGNALFWVNLMANGTGDPRVLHAGLPVGEGMKTAMNIWPRTFFGPDA